jgi:hypothetical protein
MVMNEGETWVWLADGGASHHMINKRDDFVNYRALSDRLWVKGYNSFDVGVGTIRINVTVANGTKIPSTLRHVLQVPELSRRASWTYHRLFSLTQARQMVTSCCWPVLWTIFSSTQLMVVVLRFPWSEPTV